MKFFVIALLFSVSSLSALHNPLPDGITVGVGPTVFHLLRDRKGGTIQKGLLAGLTGYTERRKPNGIYMGAEGYFATGSLYGHTNNQLELNSHFFEAQIEGRAGYTICPYICNKLLLTPYLGFGYYEATNNLRPPSPLLISYNDKYEYLAGGILTRYCFSKALTWGVDFKGRFSFTGRTKIKNDPLFGNPVLSMGEVMQYEINLPLLYREFFTCFYIDWKLEPFYIFRSYHERDNFPFDFIQTRYHLWGLKGEIAIGF